MKLGKQSFLHLAHRLVMISILTKYSQYLKEYNSYKLSLIDGQTDGLTDRKSDRPQADRYVFDPCWF